MIVLGEQIIILLHFQLGLNSTSLNLDKPAAHGYLYYDYQSFRKKVEDIFGEFL